MLASRKGGSERKIKKRVRWRERELTEIQCLSINGKSTLYRCVLEQLSVSQFLALKDL